MGLARVRIDEFDESVVELSPTDRDLKISRPRRQRLRSEESIDEVMSRDRSNPPDIPPEDRNKDRKVYGMKPEVFNRCMRVYDMRLDGWSYSRIAQEIYPPEEIDENKVKNVGKDVTRAMKMIARLLEEDHKHARDTEVQRLDRLYNRIQKYAHGFVQEIPLTKAELKKYTAKRYKYATEEVDMERGVLIRVYRPDMDAVDSVIAISKRRSELLGLDAPKKISVGEDPDNPFGKRDETDLLLMLQSMAKQIPENGRAKLGISKTREQEKVELEISSDGMVNLLPNCPSLARAGWNEETEVLTIETRAGKRIEFLDVPEETFLGFVESRSQSTYYIRHIKDKFQSQQVSS